MLGPISYAGDIIISGQQKTILEEILSGLNRESKKVGVKMMKMSKTKVMFSITRRQLYREIKN